MGYAELARYTWKQVEAEGRSLWYDVEVVVPPHKNRPQWLGWSVEADGQTPWEGAQVAALEVLVDICQEFGDELVNGPAESIPRVALSEAVWLDFGDDPLAMTKTERAQSSRPAISAMMVVLKMFYDRQSTYVSVLIALQQAQNEWRKWKKHVCKYGNELRAAQNEIGGFMNALETHRQQFVHAVRERDANND